MSPFGGFLMPIQYSSILDEHHAVRHAVGMFDLSHMGQFVLTGEEVPGWLDGLTSNEVATMRPHQARYNIFTNERGGAHDDVIIYRLPDRWLVIVNASNSDKIWNLLHAAQPRGISLENRTPDSALIALQGPRAQALLQPHCDADLAALRYYYATEATIAGARDRRLSGIVIAQGREVCIAMRLQQRLRAGPLQCDERRIGGAIFQTYSPGLSRVQQVPDLVAVRGIDDDEPTVRQAVNDHVVMRAAALVGKNVVASLMRSHGRDLIAR